jgi:hypothetical protein
MSLSRDSFEARVSSSARPTQKFAPEILLSCFAAASYQREVAHLQLDKDADQLSVFC